METITAATVADARAWLRNRHFPKYAVLFKNLNDLPIAAWCPNGRDGGELYTRRSVKTQLPPLHRYAGSVDSYNALRRSIPQPTNQLL